MVDIKYRLRDYTMAITWKKALNWTEAEFAESTIEALTELHGKVFKKVGNTKVWTNESKTTRTVWLHYKVACSISI